MDHGAVQHGGFVRLARLTHVKKNKNSGDTMLEKKNPLECSYSRESWWQENQCQSQLQIGPQLGNLLRVDPHTYLIHARDIMGSIHGMVRQCNFLEYECAKNKVLNPPNNYLQCKDTAYNHTSFANSQAQGGRLEPHGVRAIGMFKDYTKSQVPEAIVLLNAPFSLSGSSYQRPAAEQPRALTEVLMIGEMWAKIAGHLYSDIEALSNLSRTCQFVLQRVIETHTRFDLTRHDFLDADKNPTTVVKKLQAGLMTPEEAARIRSVNVSQFVIVSPVRHCKRRGGRYALYGCAPGCVGCEAFDGIELDTRKARNEVAALGKLFASLNFYGSQIEYLQIHRLAYVDLQGIEAMLHDLPNIKTFGLYSCELIHLGSVETIIALVGKHNDDHNRTLNDRVQLDVYPRYHAGPINHRYGSYGAVWEQDERGIIDTIKGIVATLLKLVPLAQAQGIDLLSPGKGFRLWLEKMPFHVASLGHILEGVLNIVDFYDHVEEQLQDLQEEYHYTDQELLEKYHLLRQTVHVDLHILTRGAPEEPAIARSLPIKECVACGTEMPGSLFRGYSDICCDCDLTGYNECEDDHFLGYKRSIAKTLWQKLEAGSAPRSSWLMESSTGKSSWSKTLKKADKLMDKDCAQVGANLHQAWLERRFLQGQGRCYPRKKMEDLNAKIDYLQTVLVGQRCASDGMDPSANWDQKRKEYIVMCKADVGEIEHHIPTPLYDYIQNVTH